MTDAAPTPSARGPPGRGARWPKLPSGSVNETTIKTRSAPTLMSVNTVWTAEPIRAPSRFTAVRTRTVSPATAGTRHGEAGPAGTRARPRISSPKKVASAPLVAGVVTSR